MFYIWHPFLLGNNIPIIQVVFETMKKYEAKGRDVFYFGIAFKVKFLTSLVMYLFWF